MHNVNQYQESTSEKGNYHHYQKEVAILFNTKYQVTLSD